MKKKIVTVVIASMLFAGAVSAASVWGNYKGNQVIRITSNGVALKTPDVPAISYNGRTMIPISMLGQLGVGYTWDAKNQTVDVNVNSTSNNQNVVNQTSSLNTIKSYISYGDYFHDLESMGDLLVSMSNSYNLAFNYISINSSQTPTYLSNANKSLNELIELYNQTNTRSVNYPDPNVVTILNSYYDTIDLYKEVDVAINAYYATKSNSSFSTFSNSNLKASSTAGKARFLASTRYAYYMQLAMNTK